METHTLRNLSRLQGYKMPGRETSPISSTHLQSSRGEGQLLSPFFNRGKGGPRGVCVTHSDPRLLSSTKLGVTPSASQGISSG